jgi:hypothetical protein
MEFIAISACGERGKILQSSRQKAERHLLKHLSYRGRLLAAKEFVILSKAKDLNFCFFAGNAEILRPLRSSE